MELKKATRRFNKENTSLGKEGLVYVKGGALASIKTEIAVKCNPQREGVKSRDTKHGEGETQEPGPTPWVEP